MTTTARLVGCVVVCVAAIAAAACTSARSGDAQPSPGKRATDTPTSSPQTAPTVAVALPLTILSNDPCSLFNSNQLRALGLTAAVTTQRDQNSLMSGCEWNDSTVGTGVQLDVEWVTPMRHGLADIYVQRRTAAYWQPVSVAGYPGVLTDTVDERSAGTCRLDLGATNTAVIDLSYQGSATADPCDKVRALAAAVVSSLKGAS